MLSSSEFPVIYKDVHLIGSQELKEYIAYLQVKELELPLLSRTKFQRDCLQRSIRDWEPLIRQKLKKESQPLSLF